MSMTRSTDGFGRAFGRVAFGFSSTTLLSRLAQDVGRRVAQLLDEAGIRADALQDSRGHLALESDEPAREALGLLRSRGLRFAGSASSGSRAAIRDPQKRIVGPPS